PTALEEPLRTLDRVGGANQKSGHRSSLPEPKWEHVMRCNQGTERVGKKADRHRLDGVPASPAHSSFAGWGPIPAAPRTDGAALWVCTRQTEPVVAQCGGWAWWGYGCGSRLPCRSGWPRPA